jgi:hypothetical protein
MKHGFIDHVKRTLKFAIITLTALTALLSAATLPGAQHTKGREVEPFARALKPGDYVWHPEVSPAGPVVVLVSLPDQVMYIYRNGVRIGRSTVSTGKQGKRTPTGVFTVLQKKVDHESSIYKGAKIPNMQRLTCSGIAMHAGNLPGYPASAGCVRLPGDFAAKLYAVTTLGSTVIIADNNSAPSTTTNPGLLFSAQASANGGAVWTPEKAPKGPVSIIVSAPDAAAYIYRNGIEIGRSPVGGIGRLAGSHVYSALSSVDASGRRDWISTASVGGRAPNIPELAKRVAIPPDFLANARALITSGTTLVLTDAPVNPQTHSGRGFSILTTD